MRAWLQRDIGRGTMRPRPRGSDRTDFRMIEPVIVMPTHPDNLPTLDDHTADGWIRTRAADTLLSLAQGAPHEPSIFGIKPLSQL